MYVSFCLFHSICLALFAALVSFPFVVYPYVCGVGSRSRRKVNDRLVLAAAGLSVRAWRTGSHATARAALCFCSLTVPSVPSAVRRLALLQLCANTALQVGKPALADALCRCVRVLACGVWCTSYREMLYRSTSCVLRVCTLYYVCVVYSGCLRKIIVFENSNFFFGVPPERLAP